MGPAAAAAIAAAKQAKIRQRAREGGEFDLGEKEIREKKDVKRSAFAPKRAKNSLQVQRDIELLRSASSHMRRKGLAQHLSDWQFEELLAIFVFLDDTGRGVLSLEAVSKALRLAGLATTKQGVTHLVNSIDLNGDGEIDWTEFLEYTAVQLTDPHARLILGEMEMGFDAVRDHCAVDPHMIVGSSSEGAHQWAAYAGRGPDSVPLDVDMVVSLLSTAGVAPLDEEEAEELRSYLDPYGRGWILMGELCQLPCWQPIIEAGNSADTLHLERLALESQIEMLHYSYGQRLAQAEQDKQTALEEQRFEHARAGRVKGRAAVKEAASPPLLPPAEPPGEYYQPPAEDYYHPEETPEPPMYYAELPSWLPPEGEPAQETASMPPPMPLPRQVAPDQGSAEDKAPSWGPSASWGGWGTKNKWVPPALRNMPPREYGTPFSRAKPMMGSFGAHSLEAVEQQQQSLTWGDHSPPAPPTAVSRVAPPGHRAALEPPQEDMWWAPDWLETPAPPATYASRTSPAPPSTAMVPYRAPGLPPPSQGQPGGPGGGQQKYAWPTQNLQRAPPQPTATMAPHGQAHHFFAHARLAAAETKLEVVQDVGFAKLEVAEAKLGVMQAHVSVAGQLGERSSWAGGMFDGLISSLWRPYDPTNPPQNDRGGIIQKV